MIPWYNLTQSTVPPDPFFDNPSKNIENVSLKPSVKVNNETTIHLQLYSPVEMLEMLDGCAAILFSSTLKVSPENVMQK